MFISNTKKMHIENYLQFFEKPFIKHWRESGEMSYYKRYVDNILIIFDQNKTKKI